MGRLIDADDALRRSREPSIYDLTDVPDFLAECQTVDAEPVRHGKWILEREPDGTPYCFHCSVCDDDFRHTGIKTKYKYCPNCGAKMDGGAQ